MKEQQWSRPVRRGAQVPVDELTRCQVECLGELEDRGYLDVALTVLDTRDLRRVHAAAGADLLLGQSVALTCLEEVSGRLHTARTGMPKTTPPMELIRAGRADRANSLVTAAQWCST
jgi:hypothetical protein